MINGLSKAIVLYLAPLLSLTAIILSLFAFLAPTILLHDRVSLLTVMPSVALINPGSTTGVDGPSVFMGALGSCSRTSNAGSVNCTLPSLSPVYDLSALPNSGSNLSLTAPTKTTPAFIAIALGLSVIFFFLFTLISFRNVMGEKMAAKLDQPLVAQVTAWIGFFGFFIGITSFLVLRMWFGKAVDDFNATIEAQGESGPQLAASTGNAFTMVWVAYAFYAVPLIVCLAKLNVKASK